MARRIRVRLLHAGGVRCALVRRGSVAGGSEHGISVCQCALRPARHAGGRRICRSGTLVREQSECVHLLSVLVTRRFFTPKPCLRRVPFSRFCSKSRPTTWCGTTPKLTPASLNSTPTPSAPARRRPANQPLF